MHIPSSIGDLLFGVLLGLYTAVPVLDVQPIRELAEFGMVFLLFAIGLNFHFRRAMHRFCSDLRWHSIRLRNLFWVDS